MSLKHDILLQLESAGERFLSGQELAARFGVTRAAVWKAVNALREEGAEIESVTNRGYRLAARPDLLSAEEIRSLLLPRFAETEIAIFDRLDSPNNEGKRRLANGLQKPLLVIAAEQTEGRGRMGRSFYSPADTGLYMSLALYAPEGFSGAVYTTTAAAVATARALETLSSLPVQIKWVNDLYLDGRKICGILTEAVTDFESGLVSGLVIGIGVNLRTPDGEFPEDIQKIAGSAFGNNTFPDLRNRLAASILDRLMKENAEI